MHSRVSGVTTRTFAYAGWWRVGFGALPLGAGAPLVASFPGRIDEVAVYHSTLSPARVAVHYAAR
jgi:hypothetical protein